MDVLMPQLGETVAEGKIMKWFKKVGDTVAARRGPVRDRDRQGLDGSADHVRAACSPRSGCRRARPLPVGAVVAVIGDGGARRRAPLPPSAPPAARCAGPPPPPSPVPPPTCQPPSRPRRRRSSARSTRSIAVRTPERQLWLPPACPAAPRVTPLARRLAARRAVSTCRRSCAVRSVRPHRRARRRHREWPPARRPAPRHGLLAALRRLTAPSRRAGQGAVPRRAASGKCRSTACARPSPRGWCRRSRPSRIST